MSNELDFQRLANLFDDGEYSHVVSLIDPMFESDLVSPGVIRLYRQSQRNLGHFQIALDTLTKLTSKNPLAANEVALFLIDIGNLSLAQAWVKNSKDKVVRAQWRQATKSPFKGLLQKKLFARAPCLVTRHLYNSVAHLTTTDRHIEVLAKLNQSRRYLEAIAYYSSIRTAKDFRIVYEVAHSYHRLDRFQEELEILLPLIDRSDCAPRDLEAVGIACYSLGRTAEAENALRRSLDLSLRPYAGLCLTIILWQSKRELECFELAQALYTTPWTKQSGRIGLLMAGLSRLSTNDYVRVMLNLNIRSNDSPLST